MKKITKKKDHKSNEENEQNLSRAITALKNVGAVFKTELEAFLDANPYLIQFCRLTKNNEEKYKIITKPVYDDSLKFLNKLNFFYEQTQQLEQLCKRFSSASIFEKYLVQLAKLYGFYLHYYAIFYAIEDGLNDDYIQLSFHELSQLYPSIAMHVIVDQEFELYLARAFCFYVKNVLDKCCSMPTVDNLKNLREATNSFRKFINNTNTHEIKLGCMTQFIFFNSHPISRSLVSAVTRNMQNDPIFIYGETILNLTKQKDETQISDKLYGFFSEAAIFYCNTYYLNLRTSQKDIEAMTKLVDIQLALASIPLKDNVETILEHVNNMYKPEKIVTTFTYITQHLLAMKQPFNHQTMFQYYEIVFKILTFYDQSLRICEDILNKTLAKINDTETISWKCTYDLLILKKSILRNKLKIHDVLTLYKQQDTKQEKLHTAENLKKVIEKLSSMDSALEKSEINYQKIILEEETEKARKKIDLKKLKKQIIKEQQLRNAYIDAKKNVELQSVDKKTSSVENASNSADEIQILFTNAEQLVSELKFREAAILYMRIQATLKNPNDARHIKAEIQLGDIYKNLALTDTDIKEQQAKYNEKAYQTYKNAAYLAQKFLNNNTSAESTLILECTALKDIVDAVLAEYDIKVSKESTSNQRDVLEEVSHSQQPINNQIEDDQAETTPDVEIVNDANLPLDEITKAVINLLLEKDYFVAVVGGYIRCHFLGNKPHDVDLVILKKNFSQLSNETTLLAAYDIIKQQFPQCEIRSIKYPNIFLQSNESIIEISMLKVIDLRKLCNAELTDNLLLKLLYVDGNYRDTTDNAIYYDVKHNRFIDFFKGIKDLQNNRIRFIKNPQHSLTEDPLRIFRIIRFICERSAKKNPANYHSVILTAVQDQINSLENINPDRFFSEITKLFFRGYALETWKFLQQNAIAKHFFSLPKDQTYLNSTNYLRYEIMLKLILAAMDNWIQHNKYYDPTLFFAAVYWGILQEHLTKQNNLKYGFGFFNNIVDKLFSSQKSFFNIPHEIFTKTKIVWYLYLSRITGYSFDKTLYFNLSDYRTAHIFTKKMTNAVKLVSEKKNNEDVKSEGSYPFYQNSTILLKHELKELIKLYAFSLQSSTDCFSLILIEKATNFTPNEQYELLKTVKQKLQILLGRFAIQYTQEENQLTISTNSPYKARVIRESLEEIFEIKIDFKSEITFANGFKI